MQSGYGGMSEIQQFMVDASAQSPFSFSSTQNPSAAASPSVTGDGQELQQLAGAAPFHRLVNPFHFHQHSHNPPSPSAPMQFSHFHSVPITQQLFTRLPHPQHHPHNFRLFEPTPPLLDHGPEADNNSRGSIMPSFLAAANMNFKLAGDDSSGSGIFQDDDASESRFRPWHRPEDCHIKEPFWRRPLELDSINRNNKRYKDKEPEEPLHFGNSERSHESAAGVENSQSHPTEIFSELEAIYRPGGNTSITGNVNAINQTTASGSALTGDDRPIMPAGSEEHPNYKKNGRQQSRRLMKKVQMEATSDFFSGMVKKLMDHQETLHQKFIDAMEQRDRERVGREETWREQEVVRARREVVARANERALAVAREAAIISFVEKITGETLNLPSSNNYSQLPADAIGDIEKQDINAQGGNTATTLMLTTSRWPRSEVEALIRVRSGLEWRFQEPSLKGPLWEEVSSSMAAIGYQRSAKRCKEKWENINKYFRKAKDSGRKRSQQSKTCPYFQQLDQLYSKSSVPPPDRRRKKNSDLFYDDDDRDEGLTEEVKINQTGLFSERL